MAAPSGGTVFNEALLGSPTRQRIDFTAVPGPAVPTQAPAAAAGPAATAFVDVPQIVQSFRSSSRDLLVVLSLFNMVKQHG